MLRQRKEKDLPSNNHNIMQISSPNKKKTQRFPLFFAILIGLATGIAYYIFTLSEGTIDTKNDLQTFIDPQAYYKTDIDNSNENDSLDHFEMESGGGKGKKGGLRENSNAIGINDLENEADKDTKRKIDCKSFDHGDTSPEEGLDSIFNCNSEFARCKYHYPAKFFDPDCGIGKAYVDEVEVLKQLHAERKLWLNGPPIVIPWASITPKATTSKFHPEPFPTHNISMTHVHKTGGTSLVNAFGQILSKNVKGFRHTVYMPLKSGPNAPKYPLNTQKVLARKNITATTPFKRTEKASKFLDGAVKYRSEWGEHDHTLFAVIRDPAERFISAIGQATGAFGSTGNGIGRQLIKECLKETSMQTLSCFVDLVQNNSTLIEVHFTPMVLEISFATMWKDIPVAVFPFEEVPALMHELGADPKSKRKDGHKKGYRKDPVLTNMTFASYTKESLIQLCEIYWMDILFLNFIGYPTNCDFLLD